MTSHKGRRKRRHHRSRRRKRLILLAGTLLITLFAAFGLVLAKDILTAKSLLNIAKYDLTTAVGLAKNTEFAKSKACFEKAEIDFSNARKSLDQPSLKIVSSLPLIDQNIDAIAILTSTGAEVARTGQFLSMASMQFPVKNRRLDYNIVNRRIDLRPFVTAQPYLKKADTHALLAVEEYKKMPTGLLLPPIKNAEQEIGRELNNLKRITSTTSKTFAILPDALGAKGERRYFLAVQNNAELRATGGLIGCYGIITVENGKFSLDDFDKITALQRKDQPVEAPKDFVDRYSQFKATTIWSNVNMSPDFPTVGQVLLNLYKSNAGENLDGVISIDPVGLQYLLEAVGPVWVPKASVKISASNVVNWTLIEAYNRYQERERRDFLIDVTKAVWERLLSGQVGDMSKLASQFASALDDKHMMFYSTNKVEQGVFEDLGYADSLIPTTGDFLQVLMQNQGANKVDVYLHENIDYSISLNKDGSAHAKVTVKVTNNTPNVGLPAIVAGEEPLGAKDGSSNTYLSVYAPKNAQLMDVTVDDKPSIPEISYEKDKKVFSDYLYIAPGTSSEASFTYNLPKALIVNGKDIDYILNYQAQPIINPAKLTIKIKLPKGFDTLDLPTGMKRQEREVTLTETLVSDKQLNLRLVANR